MCKLGRIRIRVSQIILPDANKKKLDSLNGEVPNRANSHTRELHKARGPHYSPGGAGSKSGAIPCRQRRVKIMDYTMQAAQGQNVYLGLGLNNVNLVR